MLIDEELARNMCKNPLQWVGFQIRVEPSRIRLNRIRKSEQLAILNKAIKETAYLCGYLAANIKSREKNNQPVPWAFTDRMGVIKDFYRRLLESRLDVEKGKVTIHTLFVNNVAFVSSGEIYK